MLKDEQERRADPANGPSETLARSRWLWPALYLGAFTLLGLLFASRTYVIYSFYPERSVSAAEAILPSLTDWYLWALLAPAALWLARRFPVERPGERGDWWHPLAVHLLAGVLVASLKFGLDCVVSRLVPWISPVSLVVPVFISQLYPNFITYSVIVAIGHVIEYARRYRARELRASQLEAKLARVQLQVLRMQLQPHFLFNTLHAVSTLMHRDVEAADRVLVRLSDLLRLTIDRIGVHEVSLKEELEFLGSYVEIEEARFRDRLTVETAIDPETLDARVPNLLLQPLVENAIRHGLAPRAAPGHVRVTAERADGRLRLTVEDDGPGLTAGAETEPSGSGLGLANIRARLQQLYGPDHEFRLRNRPQGGLIVTISIPFRQGVAREPDAGAAVAHREGRPAREEGEET